jgi:hypothetical protein
MPRYQSLLGGLLFSQTDRSIDKSNNTLINILRRQIICLVLLHTIYFKERKYMKIQYTNILFDQINIYLSYNKNRSTLVQLFCRSIWICYYEPDTGSWSIDLSTLCEQSAGAKGFLIKQKNEFF